MAVITCVLIAITCAGSGKNRILRRQSLGVNLSQAIEYGGVEIVIEQEFSKHWSIEASSLLVLEMVLSKPSKDETEHYENIGKTKEKVPLYGHDFMTGNIRIAYWPHEVYSGIFMMAGCRQGQENGLRGNIKVGYAIKLHKGFRCSLAYDQSFGRSQENDISLTISYTY